MIENGFSQRQIEQALVSCLMQWPDQTFPVLTQYKIGETHFFDFQNRTLFKEVETRFRAGKPIDLIGLTNELRETGVLTQLGDHPTGGAHGAYFVTDTWTLCHDPGIASYYAGIITNAFTKRQLYDCSEELKIEAQEPLREAADVIDSTVSRLTEIRQIKPNRETSFGEDVDALLERLDHGTEAADIVKTGILGIDQDSKLRQGNMPLIVGHRKAGKSILALTITLNVARQGIPVLYFSLEDRKPSVLDRLYAGVSRIPIESVNASPETMSAIGALRQLPIHIKDDCQDLRQIEGIASELKARKNIGLIVVDYAQIVKLPVRKDVTRSQQVAEISRSFRQLAMELNTPLILLSQLNQDDQTFESRALEQDATACWQVLVPKDLKEQRNIRYVSIPWQRNGPSGIKFKVTFLGAIARIENYTD